MHVVDQFQWLPASYQVTYIYNGIKNPALLTTSIPSTPLQSLPFKGLQPGHSRVYFDSSFLYSPDARAASNLLVRDDG